MTISVGEFIIISNYVKKLGRVSIVMQKFRKRFIAYLCLLLMLVPYVGHTVPGLVETVYAAETKGKVNGSKVNVRQGAGTSCDFVYGPDGKKIQLDVNHEVTILAEEKASDGALWYKVSFYFGGASYNGYVYAEYVTPIKEVQYTEDTDFEKYLEEQKFPESYKDALRKLHTLYPKWTFVADHVNYSWDEVLKNESIIGRSLVPSDSISSWKSTDPTAYDSWSGRWYGFDGSDWVAASEEIVAYCLDPRNFLDEVSVFQFEKLAYDSGLHTMDGVTSTLKGTFMDNVTISDDMGGKITYSEALLRASLITGVSPYHLASRIIQEMGPQGGSKSISGAVSGYENLYNYYNQGAYAHDGRSAVINGLIYARSKGWTSRYKAIVGGAEYIGKNYINAGQNTLYYEKFDLVGTPYTHQYMTNILAPSSEAVNVAKGYTEEMRKQLNLVFVIPVYANMPAEACAKPTGDGSPTNVLNSLSVEGYNLTPTYSKFVYEYDVIVGKDVASVKIAATALDSSAKVEGAGTVSLVEGDNIVKIKVTAVNGDEKTYTLNIYRGDTAILPPGTDTTDNGTGTDNTVTVTPGETTNPDYKVTTSYKIDETTKYISGITPGSTAIDVLNAIKTSEGEAYVLNADGTINSGTVATGNQLLCVDKDGKEARKYTFVIYGDVDGDGKIDILDTLYVKRHVMMIEQLSGAYLAAADADRLNDGVSILDMLYVKRHVVGVSQIIQ